MLGLKLPTDPRWVNIAKKNIEDILVDHAYCEQKAASSCISLIVQYAQFEKLVEVLTPVVAEEWEHFQRVLAHLTKRGYSLGRQRKDEYVAALLSSIPKGGSKVEQLVERLLVNALIEARSCERFKLLWQQINDADLKNFYHELMISEAGHYRNFIKLAKEYQDPAKVQLRWEHWLNLESNIIAALQVRPDRMH
ncbi:MAG: tRNA 2-methylthio-N6-isopentenyl adenosine(37) hydroxylase MiaE [Cyclobacteriaceae bacterium]|nr:MAG: tRNA 2-methylthio-N6-isopentenyl adenosine(37) hydroxylase MiaE [Cyclobacteriaceae bacterium]